MQTAFEQLKIFQKSDLSKFLGLREGEFKIGQKVKLLSSEIKDLKQNISQNAQNCKFAILGIPEDFGPRGNCGRGGSTGAWDAFLAKFLNVQNNQFLDGDNILLVGNVITQDLQEQSEKLDIKIPEQLKEIRDLVQKLDERVVPVIQEIAESGLIPIVIGGGHNNSYGMLRGYSQAVKTPINAINIDPHADFRGKEGRHSGNGFSYAASEGFLNHYHVLGLHESYNNQEILDQVNEKFGFTTFDDIMRGNVTFQQALQKSINQVRNGKCGIEIDLDCIEYMPTSAFTPSGVSSTEIRQYVCKCAQELDSVYLHIAEGAPGLHPDGTNIVGKMLAYIVSDFIKVKLEILKRN